MHCDMLINNAHIIALRRLVVQSAIDMRSHFIMERGLPLLDL
jgi:hypothetical protein